MKKRDAEVLKCDVVSMRNKMRLHVTSDASDNLFGLKHDPGGIVDIEFMVQYAVLAYAEKYPELTVYTDNIRQLDTLAEVGCIDEADAGVLKAAYITYRALQHEAILSGQADSVDPSLIEKERRNVESCWARWMNFS